MKKFNYLKLVLFFIFLMLMFPALSQERAGDIWVMPEYSVVTKGTDIKVSIHVNTGGQKLAAYGIDVRYNSAVLSLTGAQAGPDGFLAAITPNTPGVQPISGFDSAGKGPSVNLNLVILSFKTIGEGTSPLSVIINSLTDEKKEMVGEPRSINSKITVADPSIYYGDVNGSGNLDIIDALMVAQYYVGSIQTLVAPRGADVDADGDIDIVDSLIIAQAYVGYEDMMPINYLRDVKVRELVPLYNNGIPPKVVDPLNWEILVLLRDVAGAPLSDVVVNFEGENIYLENHSARTGEDGIATVVAPVPFDGGLNYITYLKASVSGRLKTETSIEVRVVSPGFPTPYPVSTPTPTPVVIPELPYYINSGMVRTLCSSGLDAIAHVVVTMNDGCSYIKDWGTITRSGNTFIVDTTSYTMLTPCIQILVDHPHTYNLGSLPPGAYPFVFKNWGSVVATDTVYVLE